MAQIGEKSFFRMFKLDHLSFIQYHVIQALRLNTSSALLVIQVRRMEETKVTSIRLPRELLEKAQDLGLNISKVCENCLRKAVNKLEELEASG